MHRRIAAAVVAALLVLAVAPAAHADVPRSTAVSVTQGLPTSTTTVTVSQNGRTFTARVVQPTGAAPGSYPIVGFGHGFVQSASRYSSTLTALAASGYIVVAPESQSGFLPSHSAFADDLRAAIAWARRTQPNAHPTLDAVAGHSMGGGAAVLAASRQPDIDTVATLAAAETRPSAASAAAQLRVPSLFVTGSSDTVVSPSSTRRIYENAPSPSTWVSITGGYHCGFVDSSSFFGIGCDRGSISRSTQLQISQKTLISWIDARLKASAFSAPAGTTVESK
jgi:dienelactone hydrolase